MRALSEAPANLLLESHFHKQQQSTLASSLAKRTSAEQSRSRLDWPAGKPSDLNIDGLSALGTLE